MIQERCDCIDILPTVQRSAFGFCIVEKREDTGWIAMLITTTFFKKMSEVERHYESSIFLCVVEHDYSTWMYLPRARRLAVLQAKTLHV